MEKTPIQRRIEESVTNGINFREVNNSDSGIRRDTELDLQMRLGYLDVLISKGSFGSSLMIAEQVFALGTMKNMLGNYPCGINIQTPGDVDSLLRGFLYNPCLVMA